MSLLSWFGSRDNGETAATQADGLMRQTSGSSVDINVLNDIIDCMPSLTVRGLDPQLKERLRIRAARHGRSMEEEARDLLRTTLAEDVASPDRLSESIRRRFAVLGGIELDLAPRELPREPPRPR